MNLNTHFIDILLSAYPKKKWNLAFNKEVIWVLSKKKKKRPTQWMHGLGPNHIDSRWVQIIQMYSYSNQTTSKPGLMDFSAEDQKVSHSSCKIGTKRSPI